MSPPRVRPTSTPTTSVLRGCPSRDSTFPRSSGPKIRVGSQSEPVSSVTMVLETRVSDRISRSSVTWTLPGQVRQSRLISGSHGWTARTTSQPRPSLCTEVMSVPQTRPSGTLPLLRFVPVEDPSRLRRTGVHRRTVGERDLKWAGGCVVHGVRSLPFYREQSLLKKKFRFT